MEERGNISETDQGAGATEPEGREDPGAPHFDESTAVPLVDLGDHVTVIDLSHPDNAHRLAAIKARGRAIAERERNRPGWTAKP